MKRKNKTSLLKNIVSTVVKTTPMVLFGIALIYGGLLIKGLDMPTVLPVEDVRVVGKLVFLDEDEIRSLVKDNIDGGYFTVDLNVIRDVLVQQPWIKTVSLRRQWPAHLDVIISEQVPVAYWNDDGYISESGEVFRPHVVDRQLNLPILNGPAGHHDNVWKFMNVLYQEMALLEFEVVRLDLDERRSWQLVISEQAGTGDLDGTTTSVASNTIDVKLGRFETDKRLKRFVRILPSLAVGHGSESGALADKNIKVIDMRYPNGFAVQMTEKQVKGA